MKRAEIQKLMM